MGKRPTFSNPEKYDEEIQKRRREIREEIDAWSKSNDCNELVEKIIGKTLENNAVIKSLSLCLHEHEPFSTRIKEKSKAVFEEHRKSNQLGAIFKWGGIVITAAIAAVLSSAATILATRLIGKN